MRDKLFAAALLCAISFNAIQASESNPYGTGQENTRQPRCIRVITEIPVDMAGFIPRQGYGYSSAVESKTVESFLDSSAKKSTTEEVILQLIAALTKNLKVIPSVDDTTPTSNNVEYLPDPDYGPTFGVIKGEEVAVKAAREEAAAKAKEATAALEAEEKAKKALEEAKRDKETADKIEEREKAAAAAEATALRLSGEAVLAVREANSAAADAVAASHPAFTYQDPTARSIADISFNKLNQSRFARLGDTEKTEQLRSKTSQFMKQPQATNPLSTDVAKADGLLKTLRSTGATYDDIRKNLGSLPISTEVRNVAFWALPPAVLG